MTVSRETLNPYREAAMSGLSVAGFPEFVIIFIIMLFLLPRNDDDIV